MATNPEPDPSGQNEESGSGGTSAGGWLGVIALLALIGLVLYRIYPGGGVPKRNEPGWIDNIFGTNLVIFAARLVLLSAGIVLAFLAVHMAWSVIRWFKEGHLLTKIGPVQVSEHAVDTLRAELEFWRGQAETLNDQVQTLKERLLESEELLEAVLEEEEPGLDAGTTLEEDQREAP